MGKYGYGGSARKISRRLKKGTAAPSLFEKRLSAAEDFMQHITVVPYDPRWEQAFADEAAEIRRILGGNCIAVHHIGSTAVRGLAAKPVIDIMPVVKDLSEADACRPAFEAFGYEWMGEFGIAGRRYLRKGGDERTHQIHIFSREDTANITRHLAVRDYLRAHAAEREAYAALKAALAAEHPYDIEGYCDGKEAFVRALEQRALAEKGCGDGR